MTDDNTEFDFQKALKGIQEGKPFTGKDGILTSLIKNLAETAPAEAKPVRRAVFAVPILRAWLPHPLIGQAT